MKYWSIGILSLSIGLTACDKPVETHEPILRPVRYITVVENDGARTRTFAGTSRSTQTSRLSFKVSGTIVELPIEVGDYLEAGALLARLDASTFNLEVQQAEATLLQTQAAERNSLSNYERLKGLYENNNASRNDLDSARAVAESATAQVRAAQKSLELARLNRSYTRLTAERDCTVASVTVDLNENVTAGAEISRVNCGRGLEIELGIPDSLISEITPDTKVNIIFDSISSLNFSGTVTEIGISSSSGGPTFPVTVSVDGNDPRLRSGLAADVTFQFVSTRVGDAHLIPLAAVGHDGDAAYVFIAEPDGDGGQATVSKRAVDTGELTDFGIEILSGVADGDRVVTAGVSVIREGQRVLLD